MSARDCLKLVVLATFIHGCSTLGVNDMFVADGKTAEGDSGRGSKEREFSELAIHLVEDDLFDPVSVGRRLKVSLNPKESSGVIDPTVGWMYYDAQNQADDSLFGRIDYRMYVETTGTKSGRITTSVALELRVRENLCIAGDDLVRDHFSGSIDEYAKAQNPLSGEAVFPLTFSGTRVLLTYRAKGHCVKEIFFARNRSTR